MDGKLHPSRPAMANEDYLEMPQLSQQPQQQDQPPTALDETPEVVVETVMSHDSDQEHRNDKNNDDDDNDDSSKRPRDAMERTVAMIINMALYFFAAIAICAIVMICFFLAQFGGVLVLVIVSVLVTAIISLACFLDQVMREDANWKPMRSKIQQFKAYATAAILDEVYNFKRDWNEHLLLTDGTVRNNDDETLRNNHDDDDDDPAVFVATSTDKAKKRMFRARGGGGKSVMFQLVKPFLRIRKLGRRKKDNTKVNDPDRASETYIPPVV